MTLALRSLEPDSRCDQRVFLHDVPWAQYEALCETRGDSAFPRLTYLEGTALGGGCRLLTRL